MCSILSVYTTIIGLLRWEQFNGWVYSSVDRAANNGVFVKVLRERNIADPTFEPFYSHTNNLLGKELSES